MRLTMAIAAFFCMTVFMLPQGSAAETPFYQGDLTLSLNKKTVSGGEQVTGTIEAINLGDVPIANSHVVLYVQRGCQQPTYPSQFSNCDNIFAEKIIQDVNVPAESSRTHSFNYTLPADAKSGTYRIDAYWETDRVPVVGVPYIFSSPQSVSFQVTNEGTFPSAKILRTDTRFKGTEQKLGSWKPNTTSFVETEWPWIAGPVGVLITQEMDSIRGKVAINATQDAPDTVTVRTRLCRWNDIACTFLDTTEKIVSLSAGQTTTVPVSLEAPSKPGAYAIRIEIRKDGRLVSLYRNRAIVEGPMAKIRKISVDRPWYNAGESGNVDVMVGTSPDHYTNPTMEDIELHTTIFDDENDTEIMSKTATVPELSSNTVLTTESFSFDTSSQLRTFTIVAKTIAADGTVYDRYNYTVEATAFAGPLANMTINGTYDADMNTVTLELCGYDRQGLLVNTSAQVLLTNDASARVVADKQALINGCSTISLPSVSPNTYTVTINAQNGEQFRQSMSFQSQEAQSNNNTELTEPADDAGMNVLYTVLAGIVGIAVIVFIVKLWGSRS